MMAIELSLAGHNALVTGANGGLGSHFAQTLAQAGANRDEVVASEHRRDSGALHECRQIVEHSSTVAGDDRPELLTSQQ